MRYFLCLIAFFVVSIGSLFADEPPSKGAQTHAAPPQPSEAEAKQLIEDGDRLADQADYSAALEKYTLAYHAFVSKIRGQKFAIRVLPSLMTRDELGQEMLKQMEKEFTPAELDLVDASYKAFGLMPKELRTGELMTKLLTEEVAGFYDPDNKRMVMIRENGPPKNPGFFGRLLGAKPTFDKEEQKTTLAHELTHALQDQLYDLNAMQKGIEKDDDMLLAFSALVEGDATLLMFAEMGDEADITKMDVETMRSTFQLMTWMMPVAGGKTYRTAPKIFRESLIFPYMHGMLFNLALANKSGWDGVHQAFSNPPTSTEQILHPSKYVAGPDHDEPQGVELPVLAPVLGAHWKYLGGNTLGEFQVSVLLRSVRGGARASAGWDGDRYDVFEKADGTLGLVFVSVWDTETDAAEFAAAYESYRNPLRSTRGGKATETEPSSKEASVRTNLEGTEPEGDDDAQKAAELKNTGWPFAVASERRIQQVGDQVRIVEGFNTSEVEQLLTQIKNTKCSSKTFPMPSQRNIP